MDEAELGPCPSILPPNHPDELRKLPKRQVEAEQQPTPTLTSTTTMAPPRLYSPREVLEALALPPPFTPLSSCKESKRKGKKSASLAPIDTHAANHANHSSCPNSGRLSNGSGSPGVRGSGRRLRLSASATSLFRKLLPISKVRSRCGSAASTKSVKGVAAGVGLSLKSSPLFSSLSSSGSGFGSAETSTESDVRRPFRYNRISESSVDEAGDEEGEDEDEGRAWQLLQKMRAAEFTRCMAAISSSASSTADDWKAELTLPQAN